MLFWIEFAMVLTAILLGIRRGGIARLLIGKIKAMVHVAPWTFAIAMFCVRRERT